MTTKHLPASPFPDWAENEDYASGPEDWADAPTKVEPDQAVRDEGQVPDAQLAAVHYNWLNYRYGRMLRVLAHRLMSEWKAFGIKAGKLGGYDPATTVAGTIVSQTRFNLAIGPFSAIGDNPARGGIAATAPSIEDLYHSTQGVHWESHGFTLGGNISDVCGDINDTIILVAKTIRSITYSSNDMNSFTATGNIAPASAGFNSVWRGASDTRLLATVWNAGATPQRVYRSDNGGVTWTACSIGVNTYTFMSIANNGKLYDVDTVDTPAGNVCVAFATKDGGGNSAIFRSLDDGNSWSYVQDVHASADQGGVAYSPVYDQFMIISTQSGKILTSADGSSWITRTSELDAANASVPDGSWPIACIGSVFVIACNPSNAEFNRPGIVYSFDLGEHWHFVPLGDIVFPVDVITGVKSLGHQFGAMSEGVIYLSGGITEPDFDIETA